MEKQGKEFGGVILLIIVISIIILNLDFGTVETQEYTDPTIDILVTGVTIENRTSSRLLSFNITVQVRGGNFTLTNIEIQPINEEKYGLQYFEVTPDYDPMWTVGNHSISLSAEVPLSIEEDNFRLWIDAEFLRNGKTVESRISYPIIP